MQHLDTLIFAINTALTWLGQDAVIPFIPAGVLGLYGFATLMLETYQKPAPPVWTWKAGFVIAWGWMFCYWELYPSFTFSNGTTYGPIATAIGNAIASGMISFVLPFMVGLVPGLIWVLGIMSYEFIKDPYEFMQSMRGSRY